MTARTYSVIDAEPSRRFPVYTRGNAGEVYPNVMTPLTGSLIGDASSVGQIRAMREFGMLLKRDLTAPGEFGTGVFGGYLYANLSLLRVVCERSPGLSALDADRQVAGLSDEAPLHASRRGDRSPTATVRISWVMGSHLLRPDISEVNRFRVATDRWRSSIPAPAERSDKELIEFVKAHRARFADGMRLLLLYSGFAGAGGAMMERFADRVGAPPGTAAALTAGLGTIDSAAPAFRLWELGRVVAASPTLMRLFDDGGNSAGDTEGDPEVDDFDRRLAVFLEAHGARGPDEWELASPTWGTNPEIVLAAVERLRNAPAARDPIAASRRLAAERGSRQRRGATTTRPSDPTDLRSHLTCGRALRRGSRARQGGLHR